MKFEYNALNYDFNRKEIIYFNIFDNWYVQDEVEKEVKKYLRSPQKYVYTDYNKETYCGFDALCLKIDHIIRYEEWARCEYETVVTSLFSHNSREIYNEFINYEKGLRTNDEFKTFLKRASDNDVATKVDCYSQAHANIKMITRDVIRQYKDQKKVNKTSKAKN